MDLTEMVDYWMGELVVSIGQGKLRDKVCILISKTLEIGSQNKTQKETIIQNKRKIK